MFNENAYVPTYSVFLRLLLDIFSCKEEKKACANEKGLFLALDYLKSMAQVRMVFGNDIQRSQQKIFKR
jgi:hypothetical protein